MTKLILLRFGAALVVAAGICNHGLKRRSLSASGAIAAFCMGVVHMTCGWTFGIVLICFFLTSNKLTKYRQEVKTKLDDHIKPGGQRDAVQVLCNSLPGSFAALAACMTSALPHDSSTIAVVPPGSLQAAAWCAFLGHYSCCCADTWASELGMLSCTSPRLITDLQRQVPAGVNGGVTWLGLAASAAGGVCMGAVLAATGWLTGEDQPLEAHVMKVWMQRQPRPGSALVVLTPAAQLAVFWLVSSLVCGVAGSVLDSLLGAVLQYSGYDTCMGRVVAAPGPNVKHICGRPWLSNNAVNALTALLVSLVAASLGAYITRAAAIDV